MDTSFNCNFFTNKFTSSNRSNIYKNFFAFNQTSKSIFLQHYFQQTPTISNHNVTINNGYSAFAGATLSSLLRNLLSMIKSTKSANPQLNNKYTNYVPHSENSETQKNKNISNNRIYAGTVSVDRNGNATYGKTYADTIQDETSIHGNLAQKLDRNIPDKYKRYDLFYSKFLGDAKDVFEGALSTKFCTLKDNKLIPNKVQEKDGSITYTGKDLMDTEVKVNVKKNSDGTTTLTITEFGAKEPNKVKIFDDKSGSILYSKNCTNGEIEFYNSNGSTSVYDKDNKLIRTIPPFNK